MFRLINHFFYDFYLQTQQQQQHAMEGRSTELSPMADPFMTCLQSMEGTLWALELLSSVMLDTNLKQ